MAAGRKKGGDEPKRGPKDEETGVAPAATDGVPNDPMSQEEREAAAEHDGAGGSVTHLPNRTAGNGNGGSSKDRAAAAGEEPVIDEEADGQFFVWEQGRKVSLGTLIPRGVDIEHAFVFTGKRIKAKGAAVQALDEKSLLLVSTISGGTKAVPTHDDDEKVKSVVIESVVRTKTVTAIESQPEEAVAMLRPVLDRLGYDIVQRPATATG